MRSHAIEPLQVSSSRDGLRSGLKVRFQARRPTHGSGQEPSLPKGSWFAHQSTDQRRRDHTFNSRYASP